MTKQFLGNLCCTRMNAAQQTMNEEFEAVRNLDVMLNHIPKVSGQLDEMHKKLNELHRHLLQIELSLASLEADKNGAKHSDHDQTRIIDLNND